MNHKLTKEVDVGDLTNAALKRIVRELMSSSSSEKDEELLGKAKQRSNDKERNDLVDLDEQMHGKPNTPSVEDTDLTDDEQMEKDLGISESAAEERAEKYKKKKR